MKRPINVDLAYEPAAELRAKAAALSDTELAAAIVNLEREQCEAGAGLARARANRRLGYVRREAKRRWRT